MYCRIPPKLKLTALNFYIFLASQQLWRKVSLTVVNWNGEILQQDINIKEDTHNQTKLHPRKRNNNICTDCVAMRSASCWQQYLRVEWRGSAGSWSRRCGSDTLGASKTFSRTSRSIAAFRFCFYFVVDPVFFMWYQTIPRRNVRFVYTFFIASRKLVERNYCCSAV